jgi:glycosyltransferase involved in cell wall biosynthesis/SAM-dependent methyltransferase
MEKTPFYDERFFDAHTYRSLLSARRVLAAVFERLMPATVVDVGCGEGSWLRAAAELGAKEVLGIDGDYVDRKKLLIDPSAFIPGNLVKNRLADIMQRRQGSNFDLLMCLEVAEHLPYKRSETFVEDLVGVSDTILFSAAIPFQYGTNHINEQWPEFWALLFRAQGYVCYDWLRQRFWTDPDVDWWYAQNLLMFVKQGSPIEALLPGGTRGSGQSLALVHPETFLVNLLSLHRTHGRVAMDEERIDFHSVSHAYQQGAALLPPMQAIARANAAGNEGNVFPFTRTEIRDIGEEIATIRREVEEQLKRQAAELEQTRSIAAGAIARATLLQATELAELRQELKETNSALLGLRQQRDLELAEWAGIRDGLMKEIALQTEEGNQLRRQAEAASAAARELQCRYEIQSKQLLGEIDHFRAEHAHATRILQDQRQQHENDINQKSAELQQVGTQLAQLVERLMRIEASFAWRLTAPLRTVADKYPRVAVAGYNLRKFFWRAFTGGMPRKWRKRLRRPVVIALPTPTLVAAPRNSKATRLVFVSGEPDTPGNVYRVVRYATAAMLAGCESSWVRLDELQYRLGEVTTADIVIVWRAAWSDSLAAALDTSKRAGGKVVFDVDDLMFDPLLANAKIIDGIRSLSFAPSLVHQHYSRIRETLASADFCTAPTEGLAWHLRRHYKPAFVLPNGFDESTFSASRLAARRRKKAASDGLIRIGYAAGTRTHQRDFGQAASGVARVLRENQHCRLVLFRSDAARHQVDVAEFPEFACLQDQIEWRDTVPLAKLPEELARFDINIAPLEVGNPYCECKSELKFFEAALAGACTVASPTEPFYSAIRQGETGFLAATPEEWHSVLHRLVNDAQIREHTARHALCDAIWLYGPRRRSEILRSAIAQIRGGAEGVRAFEMDLCRMAKPRGPLPNVPRAKTLFEFDSLGIAEVTVVIPLYNYAQYVIESLESVRSQTISSLDLIIIDDCSTDTSLSAAMEWARANAERFNRIAVMQNEKNRGLGLTRNVGFDAAETMYILPLDADNRLLPGCCDALLAAMRTGPLAFAYPLIRQFGELSHLMGAPPYSPARLVGGNYIDAMAIVAKDAWAEAGGYDDSRSGWEDYDLWCRMAAAGMQGQQVGDIPLAEYRVHGTSMLRTRTDVSENKRQAIARMEDRHFWLTLVDENQDNMVTKVRRPYGTPTRRGGNPL